MQKELGNYITLGGGIPRPLGLGDNPEFMYYRPKVPPPPSQYLVSDPLRSTDMCIYLERSGSETPDLGR